MATRELKARPFLQPLPCSLCAPLTLLPLLKADHGRDDDALATILAGHVQIQTVALSSGYHWSSDPVQALSRAPFGEPFGQSLCRGLCARRGGRGVGRAAGGGGGRRGGGGEGCPFRQDAPPGDAPPGCRLASLTFLGQLAEAWGLREGWWAGQNPKAPADRATDRQTNRGGGGGGGGRGGERGGGGASEGERQRRTQAPLGDQQLILHWATCAQSHELLRHS